MASTSNKIPKYCLHRGSGQACVTLGGRDFYLGVHGTRASRAEYDRRIAEWIAAGRRLPTDANAITIAEVIAAYRRHCRAYYVDAGGVVSKTAKNIDDALKPLYRLYRATPAADFGPLKLKTVREAMIESGRARSNINRHISRVKGLFKWAVENEVLPPATYHGLLAVSGLRAGRSGANESTPVSPVSVSHVDAVLPRLSAPVVAMIRLQLLTGMRPGEVVLMRGTDLDTTGELWVYKPRRHKTQHHGHERAIYLGPRAQDVIRPFLKAELAQHLFSPTDAELSRRRKLHQSRKTPLSCGNKPGTNRQRKSERVIGDRYTTLSYYNAIRRACDEVYSAPEHLVRQRVHGGRKSGRFETLKEWKDRLGVKRWAELKAWRDKHRWHPHQLRHTAATELRKQHGLEAAQVILGHKTLSVTQVYAEKNVQAAKDVMKIVG